METIIAHFKMRDDKFYSQELIQAMLASEQEAAQNASVRLGVPLVKYVMQYSEADETFLVGQM